MEINTWDPRKNESYLLEDFDTERQFSNFPGVYFVIETTGVDWGARKYVSCLSVLLAGVKVSELTVAITPWYKEEYFQDAIRDILNLESAKNCVAHSVSGPGLLEKILAESKAWS